MTITETIALLTSDPGDPEMERWFDDAQRGYQKARLIEKSGIDRYHPENERILRLIFTLRKARGQVLFDPNEEEARE